MAKKKWFRWKYALTLIFITAITFFQYKNIPIQKNYLYGMMGIMILVLVGFSVKEFIGYLKELKGLKL